MNKFEVRKATLDLLGGDSSNCSNIYEVELEILKIYEEGGGGTGGGEKIKVISLKVNDNCIVDGTWNANAIDTSLLKSFADLFKKCSSLTTLDVSNWNTGNVITMYNMFYNCNVLQSVGGLSGWNVSNVIDMSYMFGNCIALQSVGDLSGWNVGNVSNMRNMFYRCHSLTELDLSNWDVGKVNTMFNMFNGCNSLQSVGDLSNWDVSNVTNMGNMFEKCNSLQNLNLSGWNTGNVKTMDYVFYDAIINNLDITGWTDVSNITSIVGFCSASSNIPTFVGGRTIDEVINNNITILNGLKIATTNYLLGHYADRASVRALINGLANMTGQSSKTLNLTSVLVKEKLTEEDIAIATAKNWTIA